MKLGAGSLSFFPQPFFPHGKNWGRDGKTSPLLSANTREDAVGSKGMCTLKPGSAAQ
jgi:hypothetical protein